MLRSDAQTLIGFIVSAVIAGLIVGALARLVMPGPDRMSIPTTIAVGILGSLIGGVLGWYVFPLHGPLLGLILQVAGACLIIYLMRRSRTI
ncbi:MAG: GlsB/YeaQ/YmgE family stress response membrane protein [Actinomycetota bacterium]